MNQIKVTYSEVTKVERYLKDETVFMRVYFKSGSIHEMKNTLAVNKGDTLGVDSYGRIWWNFHGT